MLLASSIFCCYSLQLFCIFSFGVSAQKAKCVFFFVEFYWKRSKIYCNVCLSAVGPFESLIAFLTSKSIFLNLEQKFSKNNKFIITAKIVPFSNERFVCLFIYVEIDFNGFVCWFTQSEVTAENRQKNKLTCRLKNWTLHKIALASDQ